MNLRNPLFLLLALLFSTSQVWSQGISIRNDIPVVINNVTLENAWSGGIDLGQVSKIDMNGDNKEDLFIFDRIDNSISTYLNTGIAGQVQYELSPIYVDSFPDTLHGWTLLLDYNNDGYKDIWTGTEDSRVRVYKNTQGQTGSIGFDIVADKLLSKYFPTLELEMFSSRIDVPGIIDVDGDGDMDFLTWDVLGGIIEWHKNVAVDSGYGLDSLSFLIQSNCFGHFHEGGQSCVAFINDPACGVGQINPNEIDEFRKNYDKAQDLNNRAHAGSTILALDLGGDQLKDLIIGDVSCENVYALYNGGTPQIANFDSVQYDFPSYDKSVRIPIFVATFYADIDNDGKRDLIAAPNVSGGNENQTGMWYYRNTNTDADPVFSFVKEAFMQDQMIDVGSGSTPTLFDYNNDGLLDLLVGNYGVYDSGAATPLTTLHLYENTGTNASPEFELVDSDLAGLGANPNFLLLDHITPTMGDMDGDGDLDLFFGERLGKIYYYENTALTGSNAVFTFVTDNYAGIDVGDFSAPHIYDLDGDLDLDLLIGDKKGRIHYYENMGSTNTPNLVFVTDTLGGIDIDMFPNNPGSDGFVKPFMIDYDQDSVDELLLGTAMGEIYIYENVTTAPGAAFTYVGDLHNWDFGSYSAPSGAEVENNGMPTYFVGNMRGGLQLLGETPMVNSLPKSILAKGQVKLYPNPAQNQVLVQYQSPTGSGIEVIAFITNPLGQRVMMQKFHGNTASFNLQAIPAGIYFVTVQDGSFSKTEKLIVR